jgi:hypothetical protein
LRVFPQWAAGANPTLIKDPVTLKPFKNKTLAVAQSGRECGGIATFAAANGTRRIAMILRAKENPRMRSAKLYTYSCANHLCEKSVADHGFREGLRLL